MNRIPDRLEERDFGVCGPALHSPEHDLADLADNDRLVDDAVADRANDVACLLHHRLALIDDDPGALHEGGIDFAHVERVGADPGNVRPGLYLRAVEDRREAVGRGNDDVRSPDGLAGIVDAHRAYAGNLSG